MAKFTVSGVSELINSLNNLTENIGDIECKMIDEALPILDSKIKENYDSLQLKKETGALKNSITVYNAKKTKKGSYYGSVGFKGKDKKGVRNGLKAGVLEYGKSDQPPRTFIRPSVKAAEPQCIEKMTQVFDSEVKKYMD